MVSRTVNDGSPRLSTTYGYVAGGYTDANTGVNNSTTPLVENITQEGKSFSYEYDDCRNIISETSGSDTKTYEYDALGQLTRVNDPTDPTGGSNGTTWVYSYDRGGNILSKAYYAFTTGTLPATPAGTVAYTYGDTKWKDKLTAYDRTTITYDGIGNPVNDGTWTYTWQARRQ